MHALLLFIPLSLLAFGYFMGVLSGEPGWIFAVALTIVMALVTYFGVHPSLRTLVTMGAIELAVFIYIIGLVILNSLAANVGAGFTALARVVFAMGRAGAQPAVFGRTSPRFRTPTLAIFAAAVLSLMLAGWSAKAYGPPPNSFYMLVDTAGYTVVLAYIGVSLAVPSFFRRERPSEFNAVLHVAIPLLAVVLVAQLIFAIAPDNCPGLLPQYLAAGGLEAGW